MSIVRVREEVDPFKFCSGAREEEGTAAFSRDLREEERPDPCGLAPYIGAAMQGGGRIAALVIEASGRRKRLQSQYLMRQRQGGGETLSPVSDPREEEGAVIRNS